MLPGAAEEGAPGKRSRQQGQILNPSLPAVLPKHTLTAPPRLSLTWDTWQHWEQVNISRPAHQHFRICIANKLPFGFFEKLKKSV